MEGNIRWQLIYGPEVFSVKFLVGKFFTLCESFGIQSQQLVSNI